MCSSGTSWYLHGFDSGALVPSPNRTARFSAGPRIPQLRQLQKILVAMTLTPSFSTPARIGCWVRLANDDPPTSLPLIHVSSSSLTPPRSSTAPGFAACSAVSVTVVLIHIWPTKPSWLVPFHNAQAPNAAGAVFQETSEYSGIHGRPASGSAEIHQPSHFAPQRRNAACWSVRHTSRMSRS